MRRLDLAPSLPFFPTASELLRAAECVAPWALGLPESDDAAGEWAETGRYHHELAEDLVNESQHVPDVGLYSAEIASLLKDAIDNDRRSAKHITWPDRIMVTVRAELGIKWRSDGFASEAQFVQRAPGERLRGWFAGTADLAYVRHDGVLLVADWKFGPRTKFVGERAKDHRQGWFLALAFATALEVTGSSRDVVVARFEARHVSENGIEVDGIDLTQGDLDDWALTLTGLAKRITSAVDAAPKISAACGHCKAKDACPAWEELELSMTYQAMRVPTVIKELPETLDDVRLLIHVAQAAKTLEADCKDKVKAFMMGNRTPIPVGLGLEWRAVPNAGDKPLQTDEALDAIEAACGKDAVIFQRKATLVSIKKAVRARAGKGSEREDITKEWAESMALDKLRSIGAMVPKGHGYSVREFRTKDKDDKGKGVAGYGTFDDEE